MAPDRQDSLQGTIRFGVPDESVTAAERGMLAPPAFLSVNDQSVVLHDVRSDDAFVKGPAGLDVQGFAYMKHQSLLNQQQQWFQEDLIETVYVQECEELIRNVTGATRTVANHVYFRRKIVTSQDDPKFVLRKGNPLDKLFESLPKNCNLVFGRDDPAKSLEPARAAHVDYSLGGLRATARYARPQIAEMAEEALQAEDEGRPAPRYASYSVWRPLATVKRDPLAVCDFRSLDPKYLTLGKYRAPSGVNENGEYLNEYYIMLPPGDSRPEPKWYWMSEQTPDDVLIVKFADTASEEPGSSVAAHSPHASPVVPGTEREEPRVSIEVRVLAFW